VQAIEGVSTRKSPTFRLRNAEDLFLGSSVPPAITLAEKNPITQIPVRVAGTQLDSVTEFGNHRADALRREFELTNPITTHQSQFDILSQLRLNQNARPLTWKEKKELLRRVRLLGTLLDNKFRIPGIGIRFGWDGIIGLIPGVGDFATGLLAAYIVYAAHQLGVPRDILVKMMANVAIDFAAGLVPVLGDVLDVAWKANLKNIRLLERYLQSTPESENN